MSSIATPAPTSNTISIDLVNDLSDASHLKALLDQTQSAILQISEELAQFAAQPVRTAVAAAPATAQITAPASWKTSTGIAFSLTPNASGTVSIGSTSKKFSVAQSIDSAGTTDVVAGPTDGKVYVNIELDFSIGASVSGGGTVSGIGISGKASGSGSAALSYCHAVDGAMTTAAALQEAFATLVFPLEPDCALQMAPGDIGRVLFDAALSFELDVTYGLAPAVQLSAPGMDSIQQSLQKAYQTLTLPTVTINAGIEGSGTYAHSDHFAAIVWKTDPAKALLYLTRSSESDAGERVGIAVGVKVSSLQASVDQTALASAIDQITGTGGEKAAGLANDLETSLVNRTNQWLSDLNGDAGLLVQLAQQKSHVLLYKFQADLTREVPTKQSWQKVAAGDVAAAMAIGGLTLLPGSGVSDALQRSVSVGLHLFNFFAAATKDVFFQKSTTELGPDGSIRYLFDIGKESDTTTKKTMESSRMHFLASATAAARNQVQSAEVDLVLELSETNRPKDGQAIASVVGALPSPDRDATQTAMLDYLARNPAGKMTLIAILKPSGYGRLSCSPFTGTRHDIPPALPQAEDRANWTAFRDAVVALDRDLGPRVRNLIYADWELFNQYAAGGDPPSGTPNRRVPGNPAAVPSSFYAERGLSGIGPLIGYFFLASQSTMNVFDGLDALEGKLGTVDTVTAWNGLLAEITSLAKQFMPDWTRPLAWAVLKQAGPGSVVAAQLQTAMDNASLTCTVTVS